MAGKKIQIINYGMGNVFSVANALSYLGGDCFVSSQKKDLNYADAFILPGVGAFGAAMENLHRLGMIEGLTKQVVDRGKPYLGICLGMQLIAKDSTEHGLHSGIGWLDAHVIKIDEAHGLSIPHVGWNDIAFDKQDQFYDRINSGANFYFDHSFHMKCGKNIISATSFYGTEIVASIKHNNIIATQFHPEKSQRNGLKFLRNFLNYVDQRS